MSIASTLPPGAGNTITIDGISVPFQPGQTIIDAALAANLYIPHLCHFPGLKPHGSCRLCTVECNGRPVSSCTQPAGSGQVILNNTPALNDARRVITEMLFTEGNHICPSCSKSGDCTLQAMAYHLGMLHGNFAPFFPRRELDASHPALVLDRDRCILCELCVRASQEMDGKDVFAIAGRGTQARLIVNTESGKLCDSNLDMNDLAAHICPVGAIMPKAHINEIAPGKRTFDLHRIADIGTREMLLHHHRGWQTPEDPA